MSPMCPDRVKIKIYFSPQICMQACPQRIYEHAGNFGMSMLPTYTLQTHLVLPWLLGIIKSLLEQILMEHSHHFFIGVTHNTQWVLNPQPHPPPRTYKRRRRQLSSLGRSYHNYTSFLFLSSNWLVLFVEWVWSCSGLLVLFFFFFNDVCVAAWSCGFVLKLCALMNSLWFIKKIIYIYIYIIPVLHSR